MKLSEIISSVPSDMADIEVGGITNNSRNVKNGDIFVCISGSAVDGHEFALDAEKKGAAVIIAERDTGAENQVIVPDTRKVYATACSAFFGDPSKKMHIVGVTGTNGKTTVTYLLKSMLESFGHKVGVIGTIQNMIGDKAVEAKNTTPDAYELHGLFAQMLDAGCDYAVMEVSSHALDQDRVYGIEFDAAVFTNLTQDHLDYHKTMENYLAAKKKLFDMCRVAVFNSDDAAYEKMSEGIACRKVTYAARRNDADYLAKGITYRADGANFEMVGDEVISRVKLKIPGEFSVYNALAAGAAAIALGFDFESVAHALSQADGVKGRAEVVPTGRDFTMIIDYAHTPDGLENILKTMRQVKTGRLVTLFGCGGDRDRTKRPKMGKIAAELSDFVIVTSDNPRTESPSAIIDDILAGMKDTDTPYVVVENRAQAIKYSIDNAQKDDVIVLAGKGHETYQVLHDGKIHFDEREIIRDALK